MVTTSSDTIGQYRKGAITAHEMVVMLLCDIDESNAKIILSDLSYDLIQELKRYLEDYSPGKMLAFNFLQVPTSYQVDLAKSWLFGRQI